MQLFCLGLCGGVGLVGVNMALYAQTEPKIFSFEKHLIRELLLYGCDKKHGFFAHQSPYDKSTF
jgi:hypothetical protein